jgi:hypothetical protein
MREAVFADEIFGLFVISQQAVGQFNQFRIRLDSFGTDRLHKTNYILTV